MKGKRSGSWIGILLGAVGGGLVGAIVAVNFVIYSGIEEGYEASIPDIFRQNILIGIVTIGILLAGPVVGVVLARRLRRKATG